MNFIWKCKMQFNIKHQVLADLALTQLANHSVETLTKAEYRRLVIGVQLVR